MASTGIQPRQFAEIIQAEGTLVNPGYIELRPQVDGLITQVLVNEGDPVGIGQILVVLDNAESLYNELTKMDERIFIADPFGKIILGYGNDFVAKGLLKDIKKLLKFSRR